MPPQTRRAGHGVACAAVALTRVRDRVEAGGIFEPFEEVTLALIASVGKIPVVM